MNNLLDNVYKPDVLSCFADLSSDEVMTPPELANQILDLLPQEIWSDPDIKILDPACKSGVFLREAAKRFIEGEKDIIPDLQQRIDHIMHNQLFGIAITEITSLMARRSLYCSKYPNGPFSISKFDTVEGNIRFKRINHTWDGNKCRYCGAAKDQYQRMFDLESHAYEFIHLKNIKELEKMHFDVILSNPPFQMSDSGNNASAKPIYQHFVTQAMKLRPRYVTMIIPARWYAGGKGLDDFRTAMLRSDNISQLADVPNSADCFPGVNIAGGVCYFLWDKKYHGKCTIKNIKNGEIESEDIRSLNEYQYFVRNNMAISIIRKTGIEKDYYSNKVSPRNYFNLPTTISGSERPSRNSVSVLTSKGVIYVEKTKISDPKKILNKYKVIITYAMSGGNKPSSDGNYQVLSTLKILNPNETCSETYLIIDSFDVKEKAENLISYMSTKFFRFLLLQALSSIHITKDKFCFVPVQELNKKWTDIELYEKYQLTEKQRAYIESLIKPMNLDGD